MRCGGAGRSTEGARRECEEASQKGRRKRESDRGGGESMLRLYEGRHLSSERERKNENT